MKIFIRAVVIDAIFTLTALSIGVAQRLAGYSKVGAGVLYRQRYDLGDQLV